jgi:hypothetical protein
MNVSVEIPSWCAEFEWLRERKGAESGESV